MTTLIMILLAIVMFIIAYAMGYKHCYNKVEQHLHSAAETIETTNVMLENSKNIIHGLNTNYGKLAKAISEGVSHNELSDIVEQACRDLRPKASE